MEMITAIPGKPAVFMGGIVCYSNAMKEKLLNVPHELLEGDGAPGAVSAETARVLAEQVRLTADTDFGLSITGVAGPGASERKPAGLVYIAISRRGGDTAVYEPEPERQPRCRPHALGQNDFVPVVESVDGVVSLVHVHVHV